MTDSRDDFWNYLPESVKKDIEIALKESDLGLGKSTDEVMKDLKLKFSLNLEQKARIIKRKAAYKKGNSVSSKRFNNEVTKRLQSK